MDKSVYEIAEEFISHTGCSIFITGKAGSGKTTLLRRIMKGMQKQVAVVAPTGVAAINAGGTTIHSFFQLPFSPFLPTDEHRRRLIAQQQVQEMRRSVFRNLDMLIIDEVSMVRADVMDEIDAVLRHYRRRGDEPFGGVQVVFIGDMYQLPPVITGEEWSMFKDYYQSPYFFHSHAVMRLRPLHLELDKIFRQTNRQFIMILNEVRAGTLSAESVALLNRRYIPHFRPREEDNYITLTTHNASADAINDEELAKIEGGTHSFHAQVKDDFPERNYPTDLVLRLKVGAKVMFIANDQAQPRRYYNGKIGVVSDIDGKDVWVVCDGETEPVQVRLEVWENKSYQIDKKTNLVEEKLLGQFVQLPLRLAWAITIHKSQGLTFDRVVIDAAAAFASGQVYVALSRCRSLDGIVLTSEIQPRSLAVDPAIVRFSATKTPESQLAEQMEASKREFAMELVVKLFSIETLMAADYDFYNYVSRIVDDFNPETKGFIEAVHGLVDSLYRVGLSFRTQLRQLAQAGQSVKIGERVAAASRYYGEQLGNLVALIAQSPAVTDSKTEAEDYVMRLKTVFGAASLAQYMIEGVGVDFSAENYFALRREYAEPKFKVKAYVIDQKRVDKSTMSKVEHAVLYKRLAEWRKSYCDEHDVPAYTMLATATLVAVANSLPQSLAELAQIKGFGKVKLERFGQQCLAIVREYMIDSDLPVLPEEKSLFCGEDVEALFAKQPRRRKRVEAAEAAAALRQETPEDEEPAKATTLEQTLQLARRHLSVEEMARMRGLASSTIYAHLGRLVNEGEVDVADYVDKEVLRVVMEYLEENPSASNKELYEHFQEAYPYETLRLIRAYQVRKIE